MSCATHYDVVVVGAGAIGSAVAAELSARLNYLQETRKILLVDNKNMVKRGNKTNKVTDVSFAWINYFQK